MANQLFLVFIVGVLHSPLLTLGQEIINGSQLIKVSKNDQTETKTTTVAMLSDNTLLFEEISGAEGGNLQQISGHGDNSTSNHTEGVHIVTWRWSFVDGPFTIVIWLLVASYAKTAFHIFPVVTASVPDSALLIVLGLIMGLVSHYVFALEFPALSPDVFFLYLLPPIVFEAGYYLPSRAFFDNFGTILVFAVIALLLFTMVEFGWFPITWNLLHLLLFSSLISAVDPVAVLCIFEEIHVNEMLYIVVFGESLLNDAVTVVLYNVFSQFVEAGLDSVDLVNGLKGFVSFFVVSVGGVLIGIAFGIVTSFTTTFTRHVKILNPVFVFVISYTSYLTAEMFHLSSILAIVSCGVTMRQYVDENVSYKGSVTLKYMSKMLAACSETIIFVFLGTSTVYIFVSIDTDGTPIVSTIDWIFVGSVVFLTFIVRIVGVWVQTFFINKFRTQKFQMVDKVIMAYGGLRGAVAYGLAATLNEKVPGKPTFVMATIAVILFTVFVQGTTIKPLVKLLNIKRENAEQSVNDELFDRISDHWMAGVESICGIHGHNWARDKFEHINSTWIKRFLTVNKTSPGKSTTPTTDMKVVQTAQHLAMKEAVDGIENTASRTKISKMGPQHSSFADHNKPHDGNKGMQMCSECEFRKRIAAKSMQKFCSDNHDSKKTSKRVNQSEICVENQTLNGPDKKKVQRGRRNMREDSDADVSKYFNEYKKIEAKHKRKATLKRQQFARQQMQTYRKHHLNAKRTNRVSPATTLAKVYEHNSRNQPVVGEIDSETLDTKETIIDDNMINKKKPKVVVTPPIHETATGIGRKSFTKFALTDEGSEE